MKSVLIKFIRFYQKNISPFKPYSSCVFNPTCSEYFIQSLVKAVNYLVFKLLDSFKAIKIRSSCLTEDPTWHARTMPKPSGSKFGLGVPAAELRLEQILIIATIIAKGFTTN